MYFKKTERDKVNELSRNCDLKQILSKMDSVMRGRTDSDILRANLKKSGIWSPKFENNAHHIIPVDDKKGDNIAEKSREILKKFNIDINDASNGVFLPIEELGDGEPINHRRIHTGKYHTNVYREIQYCKNKEEVIARLNIIRERILKGKFKY